MSIYEVEKVLRRLICICPGQPQTAPGMNLGAAAGLCGAVIVSYSCSVVCQIPNPYRIALSSFAFLVIVAYGDSLKEDVFKDHVGKVSVKSIIRTAKERRPGAMGFAEAMMIQYNLKNKHRLSLRTLYGGKNVTFEDEEEIPESGEDG